MSITDAFRLLNSSIRGIREDESRHQKDMMALENQKFNMEMQLNDPREKLARDQAAAQLELTEVEGAPFSPTDKTTFQMNAWENDVLPGMKAMMPEGMDLTNTGLPIYKGTDTRVRLPKWQADELQAQIGMQFAMSNLKDKAINREIGSLDFNLKNLEGAKASQGELTPKQQMDKGRWSERRATIIADRDDTSKYSKRLMSDNKSMLNYMDKLYRMKSINHKFIGGIQDRIDSNNTMLKSLASQNSTVGKNLTEYTYTVLKGNVKHTMPVWAPKGAPMPPTVKGVHGTYTYGKMAKAPGADTGANNLLELQRQDSIVAKYSRLKEGIAALGSKATQSAMLLTMVNEGASIEDQEEMKAFFADPSPEQIAIKKKQIRQYDDKYGNKKWFQDPNPAGINTDSLKLR